MWESVDIYVESAGEGVAGVLVRIFNSDGTSIFTEGTTDVDGKASFLLPVAAYSMRFYKFGVSFKQPQVLVVLSTPYGSPNPNSFTVEATLLDRPIANDPRLCRCSGFFRDLNGGPKQYLDMHFMGCFNPMLLEGAGVVSERVAIRTDTQGYAQIDLIRGGVYTVTAQSMDGMERTIRVPDAPSANLPDVIFPVVDKVLFDAEVSSVPVGTTKTLVPAIFDSAGVPLTGTATGDVKWSIENSEVASLAITSTTLEITGKIPGTTRLLASRVDLSIVRIPDTPIQGVPVTFQVL